MEEKRMIKEHLYKHSLMLMEKISKMFSAGDLTKEQMNFAADVMKDIASIEKNLSKACYYDSKHDLEEERKY